MGQENGVYVELAVTEKSYLKPLLMGEENVGYAELAVTEKNYPCGWVKKMGRTLNWQ